jgi:ADP-heptose:LPS heptosyltransferase
MGDVALSAPVLKAVKDQYPDIETILVTRKAFNAFFHQDRSLILFNPDFNERHKGLFGIFRLYKDIRAIGKIDHVIDIHDVLRTKILSLIFRLTGTKVSVIDKGRKEKRDLISGRRKIQLKHTVDRYFDTFALAGINITPEKGSSIFVSQVAENIARKFFGEVKLMNIGIAPFARHQLKMWPVENLIDLLNIISGEHKVRFWFFGGKEEYDRIQDLASKIPGSMNLSGKINLEEELAIISKLDLMIAMDSSNMHMAALCGTKVVSIWGGTDPLNGFGAWMQPPEYSLRIPVNELTCRPCTVFGKGTCRRGDLACMNWLTPGKVYSDIKKLNIF